MSHVIARTLSRHNIFYGWAVVAATFLTMLVTAGAMSAPGVLIIPLQKEFGWSTADISAALAIRILLYGLMGPFTAALYNRYGLKRIAGLALLLIGGGILLSLGMNRLWQLFLFWGVILGLGTGLTAMVLGATVATRWFNHRRGLVMGFLTASSATGQLAFLPAMAALTDGVGWRMALVFVCGAIFVTLLLALLIMRDRPADVGLPVYGESAVTPPPPQTQGLSELLAAPINAFVEAARTRVFWVLFATFFICGLSTNGLIQTHFVTLCSDYGMAAVTAASVLALMGVFDFIGTVGSGWLSDRFDNRWLLFWYYGLRGLSLLYLPFSDFTFYGLAIFAVFYGLDWIATVPPTVKLIADNFGREKANLVFGWVFAGHQLGAATAAYGAGLSRSLLTTYLPAFFVAGAACLLAALLAISIARRSAVAAQ